MPVSRVVPTLDSHGWVESSSYTTISLDFLPYIIIYEYEKLMLISTMEFLLFACKECICLILFMVIGFHKFLCFHDIYLHFFFIIHAYACNLSSHGPLWEAYLVNIMGKLPLRDEIRDLCFMATFPWLELLGGDVT